MCAALIILAACPRCSEELSEGAVIHSGPCDPQAMEMATAEMGEYLRWEREHCDQAGHLRHTSPVEACAVCRYGCEIADCPCAAKSETRKESPCSTH